MIDPSHEEAQVTVARTKSAGIRTMMITGDHPKTAVVIDAELCITNVDRAVTGAEFEKMSGEILDQTVTAVSICARFNPGHKSRNMTAIQHETIAGVQRANAESRRE